MSKKITNSIKNLQKDRQKNYGSFETHSIISEKIMDLLKEVNKEKNGNVDFPEGFECTLYYLVTKLVRLSTDPYHLDSSKDLASYADLWHEIAEKQIKKVKKVRKTKKKEK